MISTQPGTANSIDLYSTAIRPHTWLVAAVLSFGFICLNHDFDVVAGRIESTVESGGGLDHQEVTEASLANVDLQRKVGFAALLAVIALSLFGPKTPIAIRVNAVTIIAATALCWTAASWLWSHERYETTRELVRLFTYVAMAGLLVLRFHVRELVHMFLVVILAALAADVAADVVAGTFRPWAADFRLGGALHPNHVGRLGAIVALIAYAATWEPRYRRWVWAMFCLGVVAIVMSRSRSGLATFAVGMVALQFIGLARRRFAFYAASCVTIAALILLSYSLAPRALKHDAAELLLFGRLEDAGTLTGRVPLWQEMLKDGGKNYWKGAGYGAYWTAERNYELGDVIEWYPRHSHAIYMEVFIDLGLVGLALLLALALVSIAYYSWLTAATGRTEYRLLGALIVAGLANGVFEVGFVQPRFEGLFVGIAVLLLFLGQAKSVTFPQWAWKQMGPALCGVARVAAGQRGIAFPRGAWERGSSAWERG